MRFITTPTGRGDLIAPHYAGGYRFVVQNGGWRIDCGISRFLVAEGSGWSMPVGRRLFRDLQSKAMKRKEP